MTAQFKCVFSANNQRITQIVTANSAMEAKKIIELQYRGLRLIWWECRKLLGNAAQLRWSAGAPPNCAVAS